MARYNVGEIIRDARIRKELSQEDLATGICSVGNLSKIENGSRQPTAYTFQLLMERLGETVDVYPVYVSAQEMQQYQLKHEIEKDVYFGRYADIEQKLETLKELISEKDSLNLQFVWAMEAICKIESGTMSDESGLEQLERASHLTIPDFMPGREPKCLLTNVETTIINNIAITLRKINRNSEAIVLLRMLEKQLYTMWHEEQRRDDSYTMIAFNLSNALEDEHDYQEAGEVAARGVHYCVAEGVLYYFPYLLTNEGCNILRVAEQQKDLMSLEERMQKQQAGKNKLRQAYVLFQACRNDGNADILKDIVEDEFHISICEE